MKQKWCVLRTSVNAHAINDIFGDITGRRYTYTRDSYDGRSSYFHYPSIGRKTVFDSIQPGYQIISFEEFSKNFFMNNLRINQLKPGEIYHCLSTRTGFTQLIRFLGDGNIDKNVDICNPNKPILRNDKRITAHSKWTIRDATDHEKLMYKRAIGEDSIVHSYNLI